MSTSLILLMELTTSLTLKSENGKFQKAREQVMEVPVGVCTSPLDEFLINKVLKLLGNQSFHLTSLMLTRRGMEREKKRKGNWGRDWTLSLQIVQILRKSPERGGCDC